MFDRVLNTLLGSHSLLLCFLCGLCFEQVNARRKQKLKIKIFREANNADERTLWFELLSCTWVISCKYAQEKLKDFLSVYRN